MFFFSHLLSLMKSLHLLVETHKYQYLILASLILAACYRYIVLVVLVTPREPRGIEMGPRASSA